MLEFLPITVGDCRNRLTKDCCNEGELRGPRLLGSKHASFFSLQAAVLKDYLEVRAKVGCDSFFVLLQQHAFDLMRWHPATSNVVLHSLGAAQLLINLVSNRLLSILLLSQKDILRNLIN